MTDRLRLGHPSWLFLKTPPFHGHRTLRNRKVSVSSVEWLFPLTKAAYWLFGLELSLSVRESPGRCMSAPWRRGQCLALCDLFSCSGAGLSVGSASSKCLRDWNVKWKNYSGTANSASLKKKKKKQTVLEPPNRIFFFLSCEVSDSASGLNPAWETTSERTLPVSVVSAWIPQVVEEWRISSSVKCSIYDRPRRRWLLCKGEGCRQGFSALKKRRNWSETKL